MQHFYYSNLYESYNLGTYNQCANLRDIDSRLGHKTGPIVEAPAVWVF